MVKGLSQPDMPNLAELRRVHQTFREPDSVALFNLLLKRCEKRCIGQFLFLSAAICACNLAISSCRRAIFRSRPSTRSFVRFRFRPPTQPICAFHDLFASNRDLIYVSPMNKSQRFCGQIHSNFVRGIFRRDNSRPSAGAVLKVFVPSNTCS